jgi:hypothetical protein
MMQDNTFLKSLLFELTSELEQPVVVYEGKGRHFEEDPELIIVNYNLLQFNNYSSMEEYSKKIDDLVFSILSELEKELLENAIWMLQFTPSQLIETINNLKKYLVCHNQ